MFQVCCRDIGLKTDEAAAIKFIPQKASRQRALFLFLQECMSDSLCLLSPSWRAPWQPVPCWCWPLSRCARSPWTWAPWPLLSQLPPDQELNACPGAKGISFAWQPSMIQTPGCAITLTSNLCQEHPRGSLTSTPRAITFPVTFPTKNLQQFRLKTPSLYKGCF